MVLQAARFLAEKAELFWQKPPRLIADAINLVT